MRIFLGIPRLDRLINTLVEHRSAIPALRRFRASRLPAKVREVIVADLSDPGRPSREERQRTLEALAAARYLPDDVPPDLLHHITDACLIPAHRIRAEQFYRPGISRHARLARQLYRVGRFHEVADGQHHAIPADP